MWGRGRWLEWACQSDKREPESVSRTQRPDLPRAPSDHLMAANSRNYCGKGKQRRKHCLTFNAPPLLHFPLLLKLLTPTRATTPRHTHTQTHTYTQIANGNSFRQVFKTCRQAYRPQDMPECAAIICQASTIEMINDICLLIISLLGYWRRNGLQGREADSQFTQ